MVHSSRFMALCSPLAQLLSAQSHKSQAFLSVSLDQEKIKHDKNQNQQSVLVILEPFLFILCILHQQL